MFAYTRALSQFFDATLSYQILDIYLLHLTLSASLRLGVKIHPQISLIYLGSKWFFLFNIHWISSQTKRYEKNQKSLLILVRYLTFTSLRRWMVRPSPIFSKMFQISFVDNLQFSWNFELKGLPLLRWGWPFSGVLVSLFTVLCPA